MAARDHLDIVEPAIKPADAHAESGPSTKQPNARIRRKGTHMTTIRSRRTGRVLTEAVGYVAGGIDIDGTMFDLLEWRNKIGLGSCRQPADDPNSAAPTNEWDLVPYTPTPYLDEALGEQGSTRREAHSMTHTMPTAKPGSDGVTEDAHGPPGRSHWRPVVNVTPVERTGRILIGALAIVAGGVLLAGGGSAVVIALEVLLVVAGLDLVITGALGHCPLYRKLGHVPASLRGSP